MISYPHQIEAYDAFHLGIWGMYMSMDMVHRQWVMHLQVENNSNVLVDMMIKTYKINRKIPTLIRRIH